MKTDSCPAVAEESAGTQGTVKYSAENPAYSAVLNYTLLWLSRSLREALNAKDVNEFMAVKTATLAAIC